MSAVPAERPILFSAPMVKRLLDGGKTQTRRILRLPPSLAGADLDVAWPDAALWGAAGNGGLHVQFGDASHRVRCPYGQPGDTLWVRETWRASASDPKYVHFAADLSDYEREEKGPWRPSIFMPRWASRLTLRITSVRVEHLQYITEADAVAEGVQRSRAGLWCGAPHRAHGAPTQWNAAREAFASLWDDINGDRGGWATNPWVWCVSFERVVPGAAS